MTKAFNFTVAAIEKLIPTTTRYDVIDTQVRGLRLRVSSSGTKTFCLLRKVDNKQYRLSLGRFPDLKIAEARAKALVLNTQIAKGDNPFEERITAKAELTFKELFELYYNQYAMVHTKRPEDNKKIVELHLFPTLGSLKVKSINAEKIRVLHAKIGKDGKLASANRVMHVASAIFNFGIKNGYTTGSNPCIGLKKFPAISRDRFLSIDELSKFIEALGDLPDIYQHYFSLLLYTGARKSNLLSMKYSDIDLNLHRWRIGESETKNKDVNIVLLSEPSIHVIKKRLEQNEKLEQPSKFVFPGDSQSGHLEDPKKAFQKIRDKMEVQDIRMHDLRRTFGSYMAISGASLPIIGKALNHKSQVSTAIYARLSQDAVFGAINTATNLMLKKP